MRRHVVFPFSIGCFLSFLISISSLILRRHTCSVVFAFVFFDYFTSLLYYFQGESLFPFHTIRGCCLRWALISCFSHMFPTTSGRLLLSKSHRQLQVKSFGFNKPHVKPCHNVNSCSPRKTVSHVGFQWRAV